MTTTSLPNTSLSHSLQTVLQPNLMSAVLCSDHSFLQQGLASQIPDVQGMMLGRPEEKILLLSNDRSVQMRTLSKYSAELMPVTFAEFQRLTKNSLWGQEHCPAKEATETSNLYARCQCRNLYRDSFLFVHLALLPATCISQLERPRTLLTLGKRKLPKGKKYKRFASATGNWNCQQSALLNWVRRQN